jgi:O-antigen/teichoic acid export membrane protein
LSTNNPRSFSHALKWAYTGNWGDRALSSIFIFILAGILGPKDFGVVAIAATYVAFLQIFLDQGLAAALIQKKNLDQAHLDSVFWTNIALSFFLIFVSLPFSHWWAVRNHAPEAARIIPVLSISILIEALSLVQTAVLKKDLDFKSLSIRTNAAALIGGLSGVGMAVAGLGVWSLVGQQVIRDGSAVILLWNLSPWRPRFEFSWAHLKDLMGFSVPNFVAQLGIFTDAQAASVALGLLFGPLAVGLYRIADRVVNSVIMVAMASIQAVSFPEFSRLQDQPSELRKSVLTCIRLSSAATLPALAGLVAVGSPLMEVLGAKWVPASGVLKILSILGMVVIFGYFTVPLLQALAKTRAVAALEWGRTIVGLAILVIAGLLVRESPVQTQITGIAMARFVTGAVLVLPVFVYVLMRLSGVTLREVLGAITPSAVSAGSVIVVVFAFHMSGLLSGQKPLAQLLAETILGGSVGIFVILSLDTSLRKAIKRLFDRRFETPAAPAKASPPEIVAAPLHSKSRPTESS